MIIIIITTTEVRRDRVIILNFSIDPEKEGETEKAPSWEKAHSCGNESRGHGRDMEDRGGGAEGYRFPGMSVN